MGGAGARGRALNPYGGGTRALLGQSSNLARARLLSVAAHYPRGHRHAYASSQSVSVGVDGDVDAAYALATPDALAT